MHTCTDAFSHSNKLWDQKRGNLGHAKGATQGDTCLFISIQRVWNRGRELGGYACMY